MAGKISEYISVTKLDSLSLVDLSEPDVSSPTGYTSKKITLDEVFEGNPNLYSASGGLNSPRTVNQNGYDLYFNDGDFGVDFANNGIMYDDLTRRTGFGTDTPTAKVQVVGELGDDLFLAEDYLGNDAFWIDQYGDSEFFGFVKIPQLILNGSEMIYSNGVTSLVTISSNVDNLVPIVGWLDADGDISKRVIRLETDGVDYNISGLQSGNDGNVLTILNVGSVGNLTFLNDDALSTDVNRFKFALVLGPNESVNILFDTTSNRWRKI